MASLMMYAIEGSLHALRLVEMTGMDAWSHGGLSCRAKPMDLVRSLHALRLVEMTIEGMISRDDSGGICHVEHCRDISFFDTITMP